MKICNGRRTGNDLAVYTNIVIIPVNVDKLGTLPLLILFIILTTYIEVGMKKGNK